MKILCTVTYYYPHISGLTAVAQTIAEELALRGHEVTVLTSQHDRNLPLQERIRGVDIIRLPVLFRISKGPVMKGYWKQVRRLMHNHEVILAHLPASLPEIAALAFPGRLTRSLPMAAVYHCDVRLPAGLCNSIVNSAAAILNLVMLRSADGIVTHSEDYACRSFVLQRCLRKTFAISPPVIMPAPQPSAAAALRNLHAPAGESIIGFVGRWAAEKGLNCLAAALPLIRREIPGARVLCAGAAEAVGEKKYRDSLQAMLKGNKETWQQLGRLEKQELANYYAACDVTVLPSVNATESFGLVQVESMLCGTPVIASDLPGVRMPVQITGMGRIVPPNNPQALAQALIDVIRNRPRFVRSRTIIEHHFSFTDTIDSYETLIKQIAARIQ